jgi:hypothetical protein
LWNFAFDDVKEPVALQGETAVNLFNRIEEYHQKRQQTAGYIGLSLGPHFRSLIKGKEDNPRAIMQHLDKELRPKTNATRMDLLRHFVSIRRKPDEDIEVFFARIEAAQAELEESGMVASPAYQLLAILDGLPPEYDAVRTVIESEDRIDVERAKRLIRQQDGVFTARSQVTSVNAASFSRGKPRNRDRDRDRRPRTDRPRNDSHKNRGLLLGNNYRCPVLGCGTIKATITVNGTARRITIHRVLYAPELAKNLLSTALIARNGHQVLIDSHGCSVISASGKTVMQASLSGNMLRLPIKPIPPPPAPAQALTAKEPTVDVNELHRRLGHARENRLRAVLKEQGLKWPAAGLADCAVCQQGKATRKPIHKTPMPRATAPMERLHSDMCGPVSVTTRDGKRYFVSFVDHSR